MRAKEFIIEADMDERIRAELENQGYKFFGAGQDQDAYLEPSTGMILKIFGAGERPQQSFIDFADFCAKNLNNPFLPQISGWEKFEFGGRTFLQIRVERLFPMKDFPQECVWLIERLCDEVDSNETFSGWINDLMNKLSNNDVDEDGVASVAKFVSFIGSEQDCEMLFKTVKQLTAIAEAKGYGLDLHRDNYMYGSDGHIVISDPFWARTLRRSFSNDKGFSNKPKDNSWLTPDADTGFSNKSKDNSWQTPDADSIFEAKFDPDIKTSLVSRGYKLLGSGQDQDAYLEPETGLVLKIFGAGEEPQQSFVDFAEYCMANQKNPFLPQFYGWEKFQFNGKTYLQIRVERMFPLHSNMGDALEFMSNSAKHNRSFEYAEAALVHATHGLGIGAEASDNDVATMITLVGGRENLKKLYETIQALYKISKEKKYIFDLHYGNFMHGSDGEIVITDPFFAGTWRN
jgi:hypothetical protein